MSQRVQSELVPKTLNILC